MNIGIIIQARMGSTRLPGKILKKIGTKTLLEHILYRLKFLTIPSTIVVATTDQRGDDIVFNLCKEVGVHCFRGSETNVLERYYTCALQFAFDHVVRMTADNPFPDIEELGRLIRFHIKGSFDYSVTRDLPIGVGTEIINFSALEKSYKEGREPQHIEHVNEYILENRNEFRCAELSVPSFKNRPDIKLTVDTHEDYQRSILIVGKTVFEFITTEEAIELSSC